MKHSLIVVVALLGLAACSSDDAPAPAPAPIILVTGTDVPVSSTQESPAAVAFVKQVVATPVASAEPAEPLNLGEAMLATSETEEPDPDV